MELIGCDFDFILLNTIAEHKTFLINIKLFVIKRYTRKDKVPLMDDIYRLNEYLIKNYSNMSAK